MSRIREIERRLKELYSTRTPPPVDIPRDLRAKEFSQRSQQYIEAAALLDGFDHVLPRMQLTGQAVELAIKAYLLSKNQEPRGHDLLGLFEQAEALGCTLATDLELASIVHLSHLYFADLASSTKFKARYPTSQSERTGGALPQHRIYEDIVRAVRAQAET